MNEPLAVVRSVRLSIFCARIVSRHQSSHHSCLVHRIYVLQTSRSTKPKVSFPPIMVSMAMEALISTYRNDPTLPHPQIGVGGGSAVHCCCQKWKLAAPMAMAIIISQ